MKRASSLRAGSPTRSPAIRASKVKPGAARAGRADPSMGVVRADPTKLTAREREVLDLLANGLRNSDIGAQLGVSENTVKTHTRHLLAKLGASSRAHAVAIGFSLKLLRPIEIVRPPPS